MFWQYIAVGFLTALSAIYLVRQTYRTWFGKKARGCGGGCHCSSPARSGPISESKDIISVEQLAMNLRRRLR
jgi:hypothetical protein